MPQSAENARRVTLVELREPSNLGEALVGRKRVQQMTDDPFTLRRDCQGAGSSPDSLVWQLDMNIDTMTVDVRASVHLEPAPLGPLDRLLRFGAEMRRDDHTVN